MVLICSTLIPHQLSVSHLHVFPLTPSASMSLHLPSLTPLLMLCNFTFYSERLLASFPTRNRIDHPLSAVRIPPVSISTPHPKIVFPFENQRTHCAIVSETPHGNTGLFEMIVGVLTTYHTQYS